ncbi:hypothetical protein MXL46_03060 [Heyndrickxia sporothermodurans]|uniref:hypothetical protein n=1 Tax=Heyndrickxia sporothermodurans TaxID=46224 RepID=UPI002DB7BE13|nr:hypothetical protein [Heyndrickxia sporothermodurans]MEB6548087.1 hypothetical protein [Heyndrickxia sporothermodurans]
MVVVTFSPVLPSLKSSAASSGYKTIGGITAEVHTDHTGDYPASDDWIDVTGEKTSTGRTVNYEFNIMNMRSVCWSLLNNTELTGSFSSQSPPRFYIDKLLKGVQVQLLGFK